jgi:hypothetical protein
MSPLMSIYAMLKLERGRTLIRSAQACGVVAAGLER